MVMMRGAVLLILAGAALTACGDDSAASTVAGPTSAPASPQTSLTITFDPGDGTAAEEWTLTCDPPGGTHPDSAATCAALAALDPEVFAPVAPDQMCTQIYGGPETAAVRGTWNGTPLDATFSRNNGCEIARWNTVEGLFGAT
jgi:hypothetical protein